MVDHKDVDTSNMIQPNTFVKVVKGDLKKGSIIYVAGLQALPVDENDLYMQRLHVFGQRHLGKGQLEGRVYLIDPSDLAKISDRRNASLTRKLQSHYAPVEAADAPVENRG